MVASDRAEGDLFGRSVSICENYAVVGAVFEDQDVSGENTLNNSGSAYIYERSSNGTWSQVQKLVASDREQDDLFGGSVAISGDYAIVSAKSEDENDAGGDSLDEAGSVYIYKRDLNGNWIEVQKIVASDRTEGDYFGNSVAISGDYIIVGAYFDNEDESGENILNYSGSAYIFEKSSNGTWIEIQKLAASDRNESAFFGLSVSISGNYAVVGAEREGKDAIGENLITEAGAAYVFERQNDGTWSELKKLVASDRAEYYRFGTSVSISGNYIIIGANLELEGGLGAAYIFERNTENKWEEVQKIEASDKMDIDYFGSSVSISGEKAIIGAYLEDEDDSGENTLSAAGSVYIFERASNGNWSEVNKIVASDRDVEDNFGRSVSICGDYLIIGADKESEDISGNNTLIKSGSVYLIEPQSTTGIIKNELDDLVTIYPNPTSEFLSIELGKRYEEIKIDILNSKGQKIIEREFKSMELINIKINGPKGIYFVNISVKRPDNKKGTFKIMKY